MGQNWWMLDMLIHLHNPLKGRVIPGKVAIQLRDKVLRWLCGYLPGRCYLALDSRNYSTKALEKSEICSRFFFLNEIWREDNATYAKRCTYKFCAKRFICSKKNRNPKKRSIPSPQVTEKMEKCQTRRCGMCNHFDHNRRTCPSPIAWQWRVDVKKLRWCYSNENINFVTERKLDDRDYSRRSASLSAPRIPFLERWKALRGCHR